MPLPTVVEESNGCSEDEREENLFRGKRITLSSFKYGLRQPVASEKIKWSVSQDPGQSTQIMNRSKPTRRSGKLVLSYEPAFVIVNRKWLVKQNENLSKKVEVEKGKEEEGVL